MVDSAATPLDLSTEQRSFVERTLVEYVPVGVNVIVKDNHVEFYRNF